MRTTSRNTLTATTRTPAKRKGSGESEKILMRACQHYALTPLSLPNIIVCTSILWRSNSSLLQGWEGSNPDGAKIYICYRWCCFFSGQGRSCLLNRLSPRKSRFQDHDSKMRPVPEC